MGGLAGFGTPVNPLAGGSSPVTKGSSENAYQIKDLAAYMTKQSTEALRAQEQSADKLVMVQNQMQQQQMQMQMQMQQQQRESSQQMMAMIMGMFQQQQAPVVPPGETTEVQLLKKELESIKQKQEQDERFRAQERQMEELKRMLELQKMENSQPKGNPMLELMVPLMTSQQTQAQAQQSQLLEVMKMANDRPGEDEKMSNIFSTLTMSNQATMNMVMEIARSGLLGGGDDHPVRDAILQGLDTLRDLGVAALTRETGEEEAAQEVTIQQEMPEPQAIEAPEAVGALPEAQPEVLEQEKLTSGELERFAKDSAFQKLVASLMNNDHVSEAVVRLYVHATSGNKIAAAWLQSPEAITAQIFEFYEMEDLVVSKGGEEVPVSTLFIENMYDFAEFIRSEGDINKWAKTGYKPKGKKKDKEPDANEDREPEAPEPVTELIEEEPVTEENHPTTEKEKEVETVSEEANES
jgi:hypothetical protein